jgi:hypothetical protein
MIARTVTVRANVERRGVRETTVLVHESGEIHVRVYRPGSGFCYVPAKQAGLSEPAKRKAWAKAGFRVGRSAA